MALFCAFLPDRLSWPCPLTSATFIPKVYLDLQERARLVSAFQFLFTGPSWDAHVSFHPLEPSLYPRSSRSFLSPSWAPGAFGSHHPIRHYLGLLTNCSLEGPHLPWVGLEASGQVEMGPYTSLASLHSNWCSTMHSSPEKCLMDTLLLIPASLIVQGKALKAPHFDGSCQLPTIYRKQIRSLSGNNMDTGPFRNGHILCLLMNFKKIWYADKFGVLLYLGGYSLKIWI